MFYGLLERHNIMAGILPQPRDNGCNFNEVKFWPSAGILSRLAESYTARCNWQQRLCRSFITATHDSSRINLGLVGLNDPAKNPKKTRTCYWRPMPQGSEIPAASLCVVPTVCMCQCVYACILKHNKRNLSPKRTGCQWGDMPTVRRLPVRL